MPVRTSCAHRSGLAHAAAQHPGESHDRERHDDDADIQRLLTEAPARKRAPGRLHGMAKARGRRGHQVRVCISGVGAHLRKRATAGADVWPGEHAEDRRHTEGGKHGVHGYAMAAMRPHAARPPCQVHEHDQHREIPGGEARGQYRQRPRDEPRRRRVLAPAIEVIHRQRQPEQPEQLQVARVVDAHETAGRKRTPPRHRRLARGPPGGTAGGRPRRAAERRRARRGCRPAPPDAPIRCSGSVGSAMPNRCSE